MILKSAQAAVLIVSLFAGAALAAYPDKPITGYIPWGAGGGTDTCSRAIAPIAASLLGETIIMQNKPGATGAIGMTTVAGLPADGYSLLFTAENPNLYKVLGLSRIDYSDFEPILLMVANPALMVVPKDSPYNSFKEFMDAIKGGKRLNMGSTGPGGLPYMAACMFQKVHGVKFNLVQFDGEGPGVTALLGNHIDAMPVGLMAAAPYVASGAIKCLAVISRDRLENFPDVPTVTEIYPGEYDSFFPWGPFYGVYVKKGVPAEALEKLRRAFMQASENPMFTDFVQKLGGIKLSLTGDEARAYIEHNQSVSAWLLYDTGGAKVSPENFGIKRVGAK